MGSRDLEPPTVHETLFRRFICTHLSRCQLPSLFATLPASLSLSLVSSVCSTPRTTAPCSRRLSLPTYFATTIEVLSYLYISTLCRQHARTVLVGTNSSTSSYIRTLNRIHPVYPGLPTAPPLSCIRDLPATRDPRFHTSVKPYTVVYDQRYAGSLAVY